MRISDWSSDVCSSDLQKAGYVNNFGKNLALWIIIGVLLVALFNLFQGSTPRSSQYSLPYSDFLSEVEAGRVNQVTIQGKTINGHFSDGRAFSTYAPEDGDLVGRLTGAGVRISAAPPEEGMSGVPGLLISWFPLLLFIGVWIFFMRQRSEERRVGEEFVIPFRSGLLPF